MTTLTKLAVLNQEYGMTVGYRSDRQRFFPMVCDGDSTYWCEDPEGCDSADMAECIDATYANMTDGALPLDSEGDCDEEDDDVQKD